jgi:hypothetical protein
VWEGIARPLIAGAKLRLTLANGPPKNISRRLLYVATALKGTTAEYRHCTPTGVQRQNV